MILPIYAYGFQVLRKEAKEIDKDYPELNALIGDMWETMYNAHGVGLAAPQIGKSIRLFLVDTVQILDEESEEEGIKQVFINAEILDESGEPWNYEEGCLSIPGVRGDVERLDTITVRYLDSDFKEYEHTFTGVNARVIQHEYDHTEGILFTELLKPVKRRMVSKKLENIRKGKVNADYKLKFVIT